MKIMHITFLFLFSLGCATAKKDNQISYAGMQNMFEQVAPKMCKPNVGCFSPMSNKEDNILAAYRNDKKECEDIAYSNGVQIDGALVTDRLKVEEFKEKYWNISAKKIAYSIETELSNRETEELKAYQALQKEVTKCLGEKGWEKE